jgi:hypothetical protein
MKIRMNNPCGQVGAALLLLVLIAACTAKREEAPAMPPLTSPLTPAQIGFGVINVSFTRINSEPDESSVSPGHLRRGSVVRVIERRHIRNGGRSESWVLVKDAHNEAIQGWLRETLVDVYDNEPQAETASRSMGR